MGACGKYAFSSFLVLFLFCLFTLLVCFPLVTSAAVGSISEHFHACAAAQVGADDLSQPMDADLRLVVRYYEENVAEQIRMVFVRSSAGAVVAHGLGLMALLRTSVQEIADDIFGEKASSLDSVSTLVTWLIVMFTYVCISAYIYNALPDELGEWPAGIDFGVDNGENCWGTNPWMEDYRNKLVGVGVFVMVVLLLTNLAVGVFQAIVQAKVAQGQSEQEA